MRRFVGNTFRPARITGYGEARRALVLILSVTAGSKSHQAVVLLACMAILTGCCSLADTPKGLVVLDGEVHDFGQCHQGDDLAHTFHLVNQANVPSRIVGLKSSCACSWTEDADKYIGQAIAPGGELEIPIHLKAGIAQDQIVGRVVVVYHEQASDSSLGPPRFVSLVVKTFVVPNYRISPREIDFGRLDGLQVKTVSKIVRVTPEARISVKVKEIKTSGKVLSARLLPTKDRSAGLDIEVTLDVSGFPKSRSYGGTVTLVTDNKAVPLALIHVEADYVSPVEISPEMLVVGSDAEGTIERTLRIVTSCPAQVQVVQCESKSVRADFDGSQEALEHPVRLRISPCGAEALDTQVKLEVELFPEDGKSTKRTLRVPVYRFPKQRSQT